MTPPPPSVSPGDPFSSSVWNRLVAYVSSLRPLPGTNTRLTQTPNGYTISFVPPVVSWDHPFRCFQTGNEITINPGLINLVEPKIAGVPISGVDEKGKPIPGGKPKITIGDDYDAENRSWILIELTTDTDGKIEKAEVVQSSEYPKNLGALQARTPIAVIKKEQGTPVLHQVVYHNLNHSWLKPPIGIGRHFFWAS